MNTYGLDPIWGTPARVGDVFEKTEDGLSCQRVGSPRCGGYYSILESSNFEVTDMIESSSFNNREKARLTSWLVEQRQLGNESPKITIDVIKLVKQRKDMSIEDRADAILKTIKSRTHSLDESFTYNPMNLTERFNMLNMPREMIDISEWDEIYSEEQVNYFNLLSSSECVDDNDLNDLLTYLIDLEWIKYINDMNTISYLSHQLKLTFKGEARLECILTRNRQPQTEPSRGFQDSSKSTDHSQHVNENDKVFISYSWDNKDHKEWVKNLARKLRGDGINATLDVWELAPGDQLTHFMEREIRESKYVLIVCTPSYREKSNLRQGGVGYEDHVMTAEMYTEENHRKFIPVFAKGCSWNDAAPSWLIGKLYIDLSTNESYEEGYSKLKATLLGERPTAPPVRRRSPNK